MNRWRVDNINYDFMAHPSDRLERVKSGAFPWRAVGPTWHRRYFRTHAEAINYADKQARRTA